MKHILKNKFTFVNTLFSDTIKQLFKYPEYVERIKFIYCQKSTKNQQKEHFKTNYFARQSTFYDDKTLLELHPYIVPLINVIDKKTKQPEL